MASSSASFAVATVVLHRELAFAGVLARSMAEHHPGVPVFACVLDRPAPEVAYAELGFQVVFSEQLGIPGFENFSFRYDAAEQAQAVVPFLLSYLGREGAKGDNVKRVLFFDPRVWVRGPVTAMAAALESSSAVLLPRRLEPPADLYDPGERELRRSGPYDPGSFGLVLGSETDELLRAWGERAALFEAKPGARGQVATPWIELLPSFLDRVTVLRDPRFAVSPWNASDRPTPAGLAEGPATYHFEGLDTATLQAEALGKDRFRLDLGGPLAPALVAFRERLELAGHGRFRELGWAFDHFLDLDLPVPPAARKALQATDPLGQRWSEPYEVRRRDSFLAWLLEPLPFEEGTLNRTLLSLWESRPELIADYPQVCGEDLTTYVEHLRGYLDSDHPYALAPKFLQGCGAHGPRETGSSEPPKVQAYGPGLQPYEELTQGAQELLQRVDLARPGAVAAWLNEPVSGTAARKPELTRLAMLFHRLRLDLQSAYPRPLDHDQVGYAYWFARFGVGDLGLAPELMAPVRRSLPLKSRLGLWLGERKEAKSSAQEPGFSASPETSTPGAAPGVPAIPGDSLGNAPEGLPGVNLAGYLGEDSGQGQVARGSRRALDQAGVPVAEVPLDWVPELQVRGGRLQQPQGLPYPVTLLHATAAETFQELAKLPMAVAAGGYRVGYWFWELSYFPLDLADRFGWLDEIWAPSRFCQQAFQPLATRPVRYVPPCAPAPEPPGEDRGEVRRRAGLEEGRFYFFFCFDVLSIPERKNPFAALEALRHLVARSSQPVGLLLKVTRSRFAPELMARLRQAAEGLPVVFHTRELDRPGMDGLLAAADAFLSLHRSEGLGLLPIESLYLEKPVVATGYGGVTDFLDEETGFPVPYDLVRLGKEHFPYPQGAVWAEPRLAAAVEAMERVLADPDEARRRARAGHRRVRELYGPEAAASRFRQELARIGELLRSS